MTIKPKSRKTPRLRAAGVFLFCGLMAAGLTGCSASRYDYTTRHPEPVSGSQTLFPYVQNVPFFPGEEYQCGPAVLASVLNYLGYPIKPEDISKDVYLWNVRGTLNMDMVSFARRLDGVAVTEFRGDLSSLKDNLFHGSPLIVFTDLGFWSIRKGHYMLVVGYDDRREGVIVYSGTERDKLIEYDDFLRIWKRGGYWSLRITRE